MRTPFDTLPGTLLLGIVLTFALILLVRVLVGTL